MHSACCARVRAPPPLPPPGPAPSPRLSFQPSPPFFQVTPVAGLAAAAAALSTARPNLLYVSAGVVGGRGALAAAAAAVVGGTSPNADPLPLLATLPPAAVLSLAALIKASPPIAAVYLDAATPPEAAGLLRGAGAAAVIYWPRPGGSGGGGGAAAGPSAQTAAAPHHHHHQHHHRPLPPLASPPPSSPAASVMGHAFFAALAAPGATLPEAFAVGLCALQAHTGAGAPARRRSPSPPVAASLLPPESADLPRPRVGLPVLDAAHPPSLPSVDSVPLPPDCLSKPDGGPAVPPSAAGSTPAGRPEGDPAWGDTRIYSPPGETALNLAGRPHPSTRRLAFVGEALRAVLVFQARSLVITAAVRAEPPTISGPPLPPGVAVAACGVQTPAGTAATILIAGPPGLLMSPARLEASVRAGSVASALTAQVHPLALGATYEAPVVGGAGVPGCLSALARGGGGGGAGGGGVGGSAQPPASLPAAALRLSAPLWGVTTLAAIAGRVGTAATPPAPGAGPAARLLAALGIAGVGCTPVAGFGPATALRFAAAAGEPPVLPVAAGSGGGFDTAGGDLTATSALLSTANLARRDPRVSSAGTAAADLPRRPSPSLPPRARQAPVSPRPAPDRPPLASCPVDVFLADAARFVPHPPSPGCATPTPPLHWPDALLHGLPLDAHALYTAVVAAGGGAVLRAAKEPTAWAAAVLPALTTNTPAAGAGVGGRAPAAIGDDLARLYTDSGLAAYEAAYPGDVAVGGGVEAEDGGRESKRVRVLIEKI